MKFDWRAISGPVLADQRQVQGRQGSALFLHGAAQRPMHAELHTVTELIRHTDDPASAEYYRSLHGARRMHAAEWTFPRPTLILSSAVLCEDVNGCHLQ